MHASIIESAAAILTVLGTIVGMGYAVGSKLEKISRPWTAWAITWRARSRVDDHEQRLRDLEN